MSSTRHIGIATAPSAGRLLALACALAALIASGEVRADLGADAGADITVTAVQGDARLMHAQVERRIHNGLVLPIPSTVRTGVDGTVDLRQGATTLHIAPETVIEFPASNARGEPVERIVQQSGNAFYDVGKRGSGRKLRVETPYLVAVIKGTQFSVAVRDGGASISLVEGSLEILTPDGGSAVDIVAGDIATFGRGETQINVIRADEPRVQLPAGQLGSLAATGRGGQAGGAVAVAGTAVVAGTVAVTGGAGSASGNAVDSEPVRPAVKGEVSGGGVALDVVVDGALETAVPVRSDLAVDGPAAGVDSGVSVEIVKDPVAIDATVELNVDVLDTGLAVDLGVETPDTGADATTPVVVGGTESPVTEVVEDVGGLLGGILGRPVRP